MIRRGGEEEEDDPLASSSSFIGETLSLSPFTFAGAENSEVIFGS